MIPVFPACFLPDNPLWLIRHLNAVAWSVQVRDGSVFIIEQMIEGDEFAIDAYFDELDDILRSDLVEYITLAE